MKIGDRVKVDNKVPGVVRGFYVDGDEEFVVFAPDWKWSQHVWGTLEDNKPVGEPLKLVSFSLMLIHPSNLTPLELE